MSFCRWSSHDWRCDLYVYADASGGYTIHVARNRILGKVPKLVWPVDKSAEALDRFAASQREQQAFVAAAKRREIGLPHDGATFRFETPEDCAEQVERLISMGYQAPGYVARALRQENADA